MPDGAVSLQAPGTIIYAGRNMLNAPIIDAASKPVIQAAFDWRNPVYRPIWQRRMRMLARIRDPERGPELFAGMMNHYRAGHIDTMIDDWGVTTDPRNAGTGRPIVMPFILFPRQREFIQWLWHLYRVKKGGICVKSRDCGASWMFGAFIVCMSRLFEHLDFGLGSRKEELVDDAQNPSCLMWKVRLFTQYLPCEIRGPWRDDKKNNAHRKTWFDDTHCTVVGEAGDNIGRGGRTVMYGVDEHAYVERPKKVEASLSANTNSVVRISSVNGLNNPFAEQARGGKVERFDFDYRDDPRKCNQGEPVDVEYEGKTYRVGTKEPWPDFAEFLDTLDPTIKAAEYDRDFMASIEGVVIPQVWVQAAIGAIDKLGITNTGVRRGAWDLADSGKDTNAFCFRYGISVEDIQEWKGQEAEMDQSVHRAFELIDANQCGEFFYDRDGMGGPAASIIKPIVKARRERNYKYGMTIVGFRGSGAVIDPEKMCPGTENKNKDYLENQKAQSWMYLRWRFWNTYLALQGKKHDATCLISLNPSMKLLTKLTGELSQPTRQWSKNGKLMIDKTPDDVASPNLADSVMMAFGYVRPMMKVSDSFLLSMSGAHHAEDNV